ncbi:MAG: DivIVA domain-containing protein [Oscillospiraceae bacterium]|nr:DivIVA domain-containing protein [Oscillospiraceae bacterium]
MITANDVMKKGFEQTKLGYRMEEVDDFLGQVADTLRALESEVEQMRAEKDEDDNKIAVLVASIKDYRAKEDAIKDALIDARTQKNEIIEKATAQAEEILAEANKEADKVKSSINVGIDEQKAELERVQEEVKNFKRDLMDMYREHIKLISELPGEITDEDEEEYEEVVEYEEEEATKYFDKVQ